MTIRGHLVTGLVRSVMEIKYSNPPRWILTLLDKPGVAAPDCSRGNAATKSTNTPLSVTASQLSLGRRSMRSRHSVRMMP